MNKLTPKQVNERTVPCIVFGVIMMLVGVGNENIYTVLAGLAFVVFGAFAKHAATNSQECPFCKSKIHKEASVCPKCQREQKNVA